MIIIFIYGCGPKNGLLFKMNTTPETNYKQDVEGYFETTVKYIDSGKLVQNLNDIDINNPAVSRYRFKILSTLKTGKLINGIYFPVTLEFNSWTRNDSIPIVAKGTTMYGKENLGEMPVMDSISSTGMSSVVKKSLLKAMNDMFLEYSLPDKKLNIGDTFTHSTPLEVAVGGRPIDMTVKSTYKLIGIGNGIATFNLTQTYNIIVSDYIVEGSGSGNGQMQYNIGQHFSIYFQEASAFTCKMKINAMNINYSSKSNLIQKNSISPN